MNHPYQLSNLAKYYRDLLFALSTQAGKHFIDINAVLRYGLTADLSLFIPEIEELINTGTISFPIERASPSIVSEIIEKADEIEDKEERGEFSEDTEITPEEQARKEASAILVAIYRKQEFDPYNREVIIGFPLVSGKGERKKFCAPLFYYKVKVDFDPLKNLITLTKDFEIPALNFQLIKHLVESDEDVEMIRKQILPCLYREDFGLSTIKEIIKRLSELVTGFKGINLPSEEASSLNEAIKLREYADTKVVNTSVIVNAKRTNAYLLDDLSQLTQIEGIDNKETIIDIILSKPTDYEDFKDIDSVTSEDQSPLFPLLSNKAQREAAIKAERARLMVIQGPPGTGKSQTIVNLICHLVAQGKSVLVASHQNKALEVITKIMPRIEYLAMSMLKGEKESINELRNKIEGYHSYVSNVDVNRYKALLENRWSELKKINYHTKRLQVRFSELKILEREQCPTYQKYHKIRDYDIIDASDSIPEGVDSSIATALSEYSKLLQRLKRNYSSIEVLLPGKDPAKLKTKVEYFSEFLKYCEIRNHDLIDASDSIPGEMDFAVGQALYEYSEILQKLRDSYTDIEKILPPYDPTLADGDLIIKCEYCDTKDRVPKEKLHLPVKCGLCGQLFNIQSNNIKDSIENIGQFIQTYDWVKKNIFASKEILDFCQQLSKLNFDSEKTINYLNHLIQWTDKYCYELIMSLKLLSESYDLDIDFYIVKKQVVRFGAEIGDISSCIENLLSRLQLVRELKAEDNYPEYPDSPFLEETTIHIEALSDSLSSWWKWYLFPKARNARKFFVSQKFPNITYKKRAESIEKVKSWHNHWTTRNHITKDLKFLIEMGIPVKNLSSRPSLGELHKNTNLAQKYIQVIVSINEFLRNQLDTVKDLTEQHLTRISSLKDISTFKECLEKSKIYLETYTVLNKLKSNNHFASVCSSLFSPVEKVICQLSSDEKAEKITDRLKELSPYFYDYLRIKTLEQALLTTLPQTCAKLKEDILKRNKIYEINHELVTKAFRLASYVRKNLSVEPYILDEALIGGLYPYFEDYIRIKTIEQTDLKTLSKTCTKIKNEILSNCDMTALEKPELAVEAFRLSSFIREDLLKNPDDVKEVATKINKDKEESRGLIIKILDTSRKSALKNAESNLATLFMINNLKQLLKRKRKTYSFVQLREQIDYKKLLSVFPCWIMSIEDVARIFPLEAGLFDYLIVDEASQCNQATALHLAYRAKKMIVVGDSKQMKNPNTQFLSDIVVRLNLTKHRLDKHPKAEFFHGRNSLLDLAVGCQDTSPVFLNEHFRCEPPIIEFSNKHFYNKQLKILTPFRRRRFNPCMEIKIINGAYDDPDDTKKNIIEARAVIAELKKMLDNDELEGDKRDEKLSVGILSPFRHQATLLQSLMYEAFEDRPSIIKEHEIIVSTVDGFQGDERDVILYSFRYAPNSKPGTIHAIQREDEHSLGRLNVAFSRARRKVVCFISMPKDNFPKGLVRDYLTHVASVQSSFYSRLGNPNEREKCQSDFERDVFDELVKRGLELYTQVPCAGFFIDFVVIDKAGRRMAVECDGDFHYEDDELREEDYQRQDIIERYGWFVHRIPSRQYYANPQKTIGWLLEDLQEQEVDKEISCGVNIETFIEPAQMNIQEIVEDEKTVYEDSSISAVTTIEDKIIEILSEEGPMPLWKIAQKIGQPKEEIIPKLENLLKQEWVITYYEKGVKLWKAID